MGNRVTRAATHLPEEAVYARMQREQRPWCRQHWEIIYQALTAPRPAEDIARTVGVSASTIHRVIAAYNRGGVAAIETPGKGGRRHQYLTLEQERAFLQPFVTRAAQGESATAAEIHQAFEERVGCQWRALPHDFPPWSTVWSYFRTWRDDGTWKRMHTT